MKISLSDLLYFSRGLSYAYELSNGSQGGKEGQNEKYKYLNILQTIIFLGKVKIILNNFLKAFFR